MPTRRVFWAENGAAIEGTRGAAPFVADGWLGRWDGAVLILAWAAFTLVIVKALPGQVADDPPAVRHVAPPPVTPGIAPAAYAYPGERDYEDSIEAGTTLLDRIAAQLDIGERVTQHVVVGEVSECLREIAADEGAHFLVVGSRGRGLLKSAVLGSVSSALAGDAPCPVVVVPPGTPTG